MPTVSVLCIGEILFDNLADQVGKPLAEVTSWTPYPGGAPANVACAAVKLGTPAAFMGCVGKDEGGVALVKLLSDLSVNCDGLQQHLTAPTRTVYVTRTESGDRVFAGFGPYDTAAFADTRLSADDLPKPLFQGAKFLVTGTLELAYPAGHDALHRAVELAQAQSCKIVVDVNWRPVFWNSSDRAQPLIAKLLSHADFIKLTDEEAEWFFGSSDLEKIVATYPQVQGVLITAGEKGCHYWLQGNTGHVPAFPVEVVDTTGAGDAFLAGFLHRLSANPPLDLDDPLQAQQAVRFASAVGALTTLRSGAIAAQPTLEAVEAFLNASSLLL
jgi:fructokinase